MRTVELDYNEAETFVQRNKLARWDGWTIVMHFPSRAAWTKREGRFHGGKWGFEDRIEVSGAGTWNVSKKYVNH